VNVGFIGLGRMGTPMARSLLRAGFPLTVYNRTQQRALPLRDAGATVAESPVEVAADCDVVVTMLADASAVRDVVHGSGGLFERAVPGSVLIEMSTIGPDAARELALAGARCGVEVLDAPVSGSVTSAAAATLTTIVGGSREVFDRVRPVLAAMAANQLWLGSSGAGAAMKLALNGIVAATNEALSEALVLAERSGIARAAAYEAIAASAVGSPFVTYKRDAYLAPEAGTPAFTLGLMQKDLSLYLALGRALGVPLPGGAAADQMLTLARRTQGEGADFATVAAALRELAAGDVNGASRSQEGR
jgi:3-hydroxyisobutyrate dehydrogenase